MKPAFGSKRKARKIQVDDDEDDATKTDQGSETVNTVTASSISSKFGAKPFKKSALRQSIAFDDQDGDSADAGPLGNRPTIGRSSSILKKKKAASSRLSFGPGEIISGDAAEALEDDGEFTPKKSALGRRMVENTTLRNSLPYQGLPSRDMEEEERPKYSKDYLNELKSSTPTTAKELHAYLADDDEGLDASELEGAMIVDTNDNIRASTRAFIPSEAEIREKKDRRARLAQEKDFISFDDDSDDRRQQILHPSLRDKEEETRLVREDEDLGEGFDEFVEDGRIALGKKQEREAKRKHRKEMADMIQQAEGSEDGESDDSEAERRAAYEAAQTRAGMDGLKKVKESREGNSVQVPPKITRLPGLKECMERLERTMGEMGRVLEGRRRGIDEARGEKVEIAAREGEVQELLKQAGERFAALKADDGVKGIGGVLPVMADRGLESFGNTPVGSMDVEDVG